MSIGKNYLILTYNVCNQGGAQLLVLRRAKYLKEKGYNVKIVVAYDNGNFLLKEEFTDFEIILIRDFINTLCLQPYSKITSKILEVSKKIDPQNEGISYIESHTVPTCVWGEVLANKFQAKHMTYLLAEFLFSDLKFYYDRKILLKKLRSRELFGVSASSIEIIFGKKYKKYSDQYINVGFDRGELLELSLPLLNLNKEQNTFIIGTVTRLDKTYVEPLIEDSILLAKKYPSQKFLLLIAGSSPNADRQQYLTDKYNANNLGVDNLTIRWTGYINKLGKDIFEFLDVFVGMGTASINSISQKCLTLNIDPFTDMCSGFFGTDTSNFAYSDRGGLYKIIDKLQEAYLMSDTNRDVYRSNGLALFDKEFDMIVCEEKQDRFFNDIIPSHENKHNVIPFLYELNRILYNLLKTIKHNLFD